jgi:hypothetical protein
MVRHLHKYKKWLLVGHTRKGDIFASDGHIDYVSLGCPHYSLEEIRQTAEFWSIHFHSTKVAGVGPAAMVFPKIDSRTGVTAAVLNVPVVTDLQENPFALIKTGDWVRVDGNRGTVKIIKREQVFANKNLLEQS